MAQFKRSIFAALACAAVHGSSFTAAVAAGNPQAILQDPPVFQSQFGILDILMVARPVAATEAILNLAKPVGWIYEICRRPSHAAQSCPAGSVKSTAYGGTRLAMMPGDKLRVRLVNNLPPIPEAKHAQDVSADLALNPTNLHTHGLIVEARYPTVPRPSWGDNVFIVSFNAQNGMPQALMTDMHKHGMITMDPIEYEIDIPANHPSGQFWFHPHVHGIALNQVSAGLSGIISIGNAADYACEDDACRRPWAAKNVRHLILKDAQIEASGSLSTQQDPKFCAEFADASEAAREGHCAGQLVADDGGDHTGGKWIFSVSGQVYPNIPITSPVGELWRLTNASGCASYDLHVWDDILKQDAIFQVVSVDGVSVTPTVGADVNQQGVAGATKIRAVACPTTSGTTTTNAPAMCATSVRMMPSSRVEIHVMYRDANGRAVTAPANAKYILRTVGFDTGGDQWPAVDLASATFQAAPPTLAGHTIGVRGQAAGVHLGAGQFGSHLPTPPMMAAMPSLPASATPSPKCKVALAAGHRRRIYYGVPAGTEDGFGLGYEEIDHNGLPVPGTFVDVTAFSPDTTIVCLPLAAGNKPVKEVWELVNVANEDHNFHIHQTKFRVLTGHVAQTLPHTASRAVAAATQARSESLLPFPSTAILHDNMPLPADPSCDGTIASWRGAGATCLAKPVVVEIGFTQLGDFVYHCHILEHEDGGMMAKISVIARP